MEKRKLVFAIFAVILALTICNFNIRQGSANGTGLNVSADLNYAGSEISTNPLLVWISPDPVLSDSAPAIFYAPHQDDETIGMGASIAEQVRLGKPVYVVLLTNGNNANMLSYLQTITPATSMQDVVNARNNEFIAACKALGVTRIYIANSGKGYDEKESQEELINHFKKTMSYFASSFRNCSHATVSGNCDSYNPKCDKMPAHQAAATALHELYTAGKISSGLLYRVYFYYRNSGQCDRPCSWRKPVVYWDKLKRQRAINEYKLVSEKDQRYGLAYWHSVDALFNNSWDSDFEEADSLKNDY